MILQIFLMIIAILNLLTFALFAIDKIKAVNNSWRIPEKRMLKLSLLGPFGAFLGMKLFRHKVKKPKFYVGIPFFVFIQLILFVILLIFFN